jgi:hypothetical protein
LRHVKYTRWCGNLIEGWKTEEIEGIDFWNCMWALRKVTILNMDPVVHSSVGGVEFFSSVIE